MSSSLLFNIFYTIFVAAAFVFAVYGRRIVAWWRRKFGKSKSEEQPEIATHTMTFTDKDGKKHTVLDYKRLLKDALKLCNCDAVDDKDDPERIHFHFQGANFFADIHPAYPFVDLYLTWWENASLDDLDAVSALQKAVNKGNTLMRTVPKAIYSYDTDENMMAVHSYANVFISPEIPHLHTYIETILYHFFTLSRYIDQEYDKAMSGKSVHKESGE